MYQIEVNVAVAILVLILVSLVVGLVGYACAGGFEKKWDGRIMLSLIDSKTGDTWYEPFAPGSIVLSEKYAICGICFPGTRSGTLPALREIVMLGGDGEPQGYYFSGVLRCAYGMEYIIPERVYAPHHAYISKCNLSIAITNPITDERVQLLVKWKEATADVLV